MGTKRPTVLSVFSGLGGLDLGLEAAGFKVVGCIEKNELARESIHRNRPNWPLLKPTDVLEFAKEKSPRDLGLAPRELGVLAGGPPCQPFSKAAQWHKSARTGLKDPRADCVRGYLQLAESFLPEVVLIENVRGFTTGQTSAIPYLEENFQGINSRNGTSYAVRPFAVDACDYGVPQHRWRSILVARRDGGIFDLPEPTHATRPARAWDAIGNLHPRNPPVAQGKWAKLLPSVPEGSNYLFHTPEGDGKPLFGYRTRYWSFLLKLAKNEPSWTLPAQPSQNAGPFHWDNRRLAWKEMLRLQSFPKGWKVAGEYDARVRQIGNATPPLLAEVLGSALAEQVFGVHQRHRPRLAIARRRSIPPPRAVLAVPGHYLEEVGSLAPHPGPGLGPGALRAATSLTASAPKGPSPESRSLAPCQLDGPHGRLPFRL